jgi:hypothetical protein
MSGDYPNAIFLSRRWQRLEKCNKLFRVVINGLGAARVSSSEATATGVNLGNSIGKHVNGQSLCAVGLTCRTDGKCRKPRQCCNVTSSHTPNETQAQLLLARASFAFPSSFIIHPSTLHHAGQRLAPAIR